MKKELRPTFDQAVKLKNEGAFVAAEKILVELSQQDPSSPAILAILADTYWDMGCLEDAIRTFRRAIVLAPATEVVSMGLFQCLWKSGDREAALEEMKRFMSNSDSEAYAEILEEMKEKR